MAVMFSSHKIINEPFFRSVYENNKWLRIGCMVPPIPDDPNIQMCISGVLVEGDEKGLIVSKNLTQEKMKQIQTSDKISLIFKSYTSPLHPDIGKMKSPVGVITSRNSSILHEPDVIDACFCDGERQ